MERDSRQIPASMKQMLTPQHRPPSPTSSETDSVNMPLPGRWDRALRAKRKAAAVNTPLKDKERHSPLAPAAEAEKQNQSGQQQDGQETGAQHRRQVGFNNHGDSLPK